MSRTVWGVAALLLAAPICSQGAEDAQQPEKTRPVCNAQARGKLWPEKARRGAEVPVEICAPKGWHYRWMQLTVDVSQLKAAMKPKAVVAALPANTVGHKGVITARE